MDVRLMTDRYSKAYAQIEQETERYLRDNTLCEGEIDRYGFGKHILRLLMSGLAMHAMGHFMGGSGASGATAQGGGGMPVSGEFEKLHPRGQSKNAGQFAEKPGKGVATPKGPKAGSMEHLVQQLAAKQDANKSGAGKAAFEANLPPGRPQPQLDATTAAVAEKWHGTKPEPSGDTWHHSKNTDDLASSLSPEVRKMLSQQEQNPDFKPYEDEEQPPASPRNYPDNLGKPPEQQTPYAPPERTIEPTDDDLTAMQEDPYNYDPEQAAEPAPTASTGMKTHSAPSGTAWPKGSDTWAEPAQPQSQPQPASQPTQPTKPDDDARAQQQAEARAKRNAEHAAKVAAEKAAKPTRSEQKAAAKRVEFDPSDWMNDDKPESLQDVAAKHGLDHEVFKKHIDEMEKFDQEQWRNHRSLQAAVRKHIGSNTRTRQAANEGKKGYEEFHDIESALSGNIPHETLVEHFGHDTQDWDNKAYEMANSPTPEKPGRHDPEWVAKHAKTFAERHEIADNANHQNHYPEPEDGAPFSRKAITTELDRYFNEARIQYRHRRQSEASAIWTDKDLWL